MKQQAFEQRFEQDWQTLEACIHSLENKQAETELDMLAFPQRYRRLCNHLALAKQRRYTRHLIDYLNDLALRGHQVLYQRRRPLWRQVGQFIAIDFPQCVRRYQHYMWWAFGLFYLPAIILFMLVRLMPEMVYTVFDPEQVLHFEWMYNTDSEHIGENRDADSDFAMFGHYIQNNISVGFQTFAGGMLFCLGTVFYLVFNGVYMGAIAGHLVNMDFSQPFFSFVIGHGALELTAIGLAGGAGLMLGYVLINPGNYDRLTALRLRSRDAITIIYGVIILLTVAAVIEAFWSSNNALPYMVKYGVGGVLWLIVLAYFLFAGRRHGHQ